MSIRAVLLAAVITGFLPGVADVPGHGAIHPRVTGALPGPDH
ncbi:hypothetical protein [Streptomyces yanii]|uniref:Uncharacterized protein n=1 Tax=Streptomyces yanii TaxID=78510 RepID=A0ABV5RP33_9ACTN